MKKPFEFSLWGFLRRLGDEQDHDEDGDNPGWGEGEVEMRELFNIAKLFAHLISNSTLTLSILRPLDLLMLSERASMFVELLFVNIFVLCKGEQREVRKVFERLAETKQVIGRVRVFLKRVVKGSDLVEHNERAMVRDGVQVALAVLEQLGVEES